MRSPVFRRPGCRRHAGTTDGRPQNATPEAVAGRHCTTRPDEPHPDTQHVARNTMVVATACHHLRGGDLGGTPPRPPRMSPRPRVAKYGATHSCNPSRGSELPRLLSSSPTSTACACRSTHSRVLAATPPLHRSTATFLSNLCCSVALSERRGIINPRRGWQPCVAPYFADLGVGDMRGPPMGAPMMPPRRRWQAVIAPHDPMSHPPP